MKLIVPWVAAVFWVALPQALQACVACFGNSDASLAKGLNWGILALLVVLLMVLGSIAAFFIYVARRSAALNRPQPELK